MGLGAPERGGVAVTGEQTPKPCSKCGKRPAGPGGILCPPCVQEIEASRPWPVGADAEPRDPPPPVS